jgi:serine/threonine-protein kinase
MTEVFVDTKGRLLRFEAAPAQLEKPDAVRSTPVDWDTLFAAAEIDRATFTETAPGRTPSTFADERRAWEGTLPETKIPVRIEAAAYRGRPVYFDIVGPWFGAAREADDAASAPSGGGRNAIYVTILLAGAVVAARANLKSGRADTRGAFRLAAFIFFVLVGQWILSPHVASFGDDQTRMFFRVGIALFVGGVLYLVYLGLEPFVRRNWPTMIVGWSRVLAGRVRDPLVGRDVVIGVAAGAALALLNLAVDFLRPANWPAAMPHAIEFSVIEGARTSGLMLLNAVNNALQNSLINLFEFVGLRFVLGLVAGQFLKFGVRFLGLKAERLTPSPAAADRIFVGLALLWITVTSLSSAPASEWLTGTIYQDVSTLLILILLLRIGLFASVIMSFVNIVLLAAPLTLNASRLYATQSWWAMVVVGTVMAYGIWQARAGEPLFTKAR